MVNNVPSAPFSMSFLPPMGQSNAQLSDALKRLSAAKYGKPRAEVEKNIFDRLGSGEAERKAKEVAKKPQPRSSISSPSATAEGASFLDEWLAKRKQLKGAGGGAVTSSKPFATPPSSPVAAAPLAISQQRQSSPAVNLPVAPREPMAMAQQRPPASEPLVAALPPAPLNKPTETQEGLRLRGDQTNHDDEISIKLR